MTQSTHPAWTPSRVIYTMAGVLAVWTMLGEYEVLELSRHIWTKDPAGFTALSRHVLIATPLVYILTLAITLWFFRPARSLFHWDKELTRLGWRSICKQALQGVLAGLFVSLLCAPFPTKSKYFFKLGDIAMMLSGSNSAYFYFPIWISLVVAISICTEIFFRGIILRTLANYANLSSSIIASCLLSAYMWSFDRPAITAVILGAVSGILFYKTRYLLPSIIAAIVFLFTGPLCSAIFHRFVW